MQANPVSDTIDLFNAALGGPVALRPIESHGKLIAAIGRWGHDGACIDLSAISTTQLVLNMTGGQEIEQSHGHVFVRARATAGDVAVVRSPASQRIRISGHAATVQVILSPQLVASVARDEPRRITETERRGRLQALAIQALVALPVRFGDNDGIVPLLLDMAVLAATESAPAPWLTRGGLSPTAARRVRSLVAEQLGRDCGRTASVAEMAAAADLSPYHFIRAFRASEGQTPHVWASARRLDRAVRMLIEGGRVDDIADRVGFASPSHFVSDFRRRMGVTPAVVREAAK